MTIEVGEWRPNHCQCVIEFEYDDAVPVDQRLHTVHAVLNRGPEHASILVASALYQATRDENVRLNITRNDLVPQVSLSAQAAVKWTFTTARVLQISFDSTKANVSQKVKSDIQTLCDTEFGIGKVEVL